MSSTPSLAAGAARVELAPEAGGAIAGFTFDGWEVLRATPRATRAAGDVRGHACYPLVPYSNRIANARLAVSGRVLELARNFGEHPHAIHGVGWQRPWRVLAHDATSALLALEHTAAGVGARAWPWPFRATQSFALCADRGGATLTVKLALANAGDAPFPFGLGFHPYFPRTPTTALEFEAQSYWENDTTQLPVGRIALPAAWRQGLLDARRGETIDNVFTNWKGAATLSDPSRPLRIEIDADRAAGFLVVYAPPDRGFVAIEPVTQMTDAFNRAERGEPGTGARILAAGAAFSCTMRLSVRARSP
jgi:aldose 1-epimerase